MTPHGTPAGVSHQRAELTDEGWPHPDDLAPQLDLAASVGIQAKPSQLPAPILRAVGEHARDR